MSLRSSRHAVYLLLLLSLVVLRPAVALAVSIDIDGNLDARDCALSYKQGGRTLAVATVSRDLQSLQAEAAIESSTLK